MEEVIKYTVEKLKEVPLALGNLGVKALAWFDKAFPPETRAEKIKHWQLALQNWGREALAWFDSVFPPEKKAEKIKPCLISAMILTVAVWLCKGRGGGTGKTMKAPGRNYRIQRRDFESDPKGYFRNLRASN